jgi:hypothetical protein
MTNDNTVTPEVSATPELSEGEKEIVEERTALRAAVIHEAIREQDETELARPVVALAWSGLAAGLSMGFSMISEGLLESYLPAASWRPLISKLGYTVGFLVVIPRPSAAIHGKHFDRNFAAAGAAHCCSIAECHPIVDGCADCKFDRRIGYRRAC